MVIMKEIIEGNKNHLSCLFLLVLFSNISYLFSSFSWFGLFCVVSLSALIAVVASISISLFQHKRIRTALLYLFCIFCWVFILTDYFLLIKFGLVMNENIMGIIFETTTREIQNFLNTYFVWYYCVGIIVGCILINAGLIIFAKNIPSYFRRVIAVFSCAGIAVLGFLIYHYTIYHEGLSIPQYMSSSRFLYSYQLMKNELPSMNELLEKNEKVEASFIRGSAHPNIVLVIGESFSKYHCNLYGYEKKTFPLLQKRLEKGELTVFSDAIAYADGTKRNMKALFLKDDKTDENQTSILFPVLLRKAGYHTALYDNQYLLGEGDFSFMNSVALCNLAYEKRNVSGYDFDGDFLNCIEPLPAPFFTIIHLWGQHYAYENRYPESFAIFKPNDYDQNRFSLEQREVIAHYDNANIYNDYVLESIIQRYEQEDCCLIYFSDHGEEVYELRDYMGHGNANDSPDMDYQIGIPFLVWESSLFKRNNPGIHSQIAKAKDQPVMSSDISNVIFNIAGVSTSLYQKRKDVLSSEYDSISHRIVLKNVDYDE